MNHVHKIEITMKNGNVATWNKDEFTDYAYDEKMFIVVKDHIRVGFYNVDEIYSIVVN